VIDYVYLFVVGVGGEGFDVGGEVVGGCVDVGCEWGVVD